MILAFPFIVHSICSVNSIGPNPHAHRAACGERCNQFVRRRPHHCDSINHVWTFNEVTSLLVLLFGDLQLVIDLPY